MKIRNLGLQPYFQIFQDMKQFTSQRTPQTQDEIWLLEHEPVYTQGQAGKSEHVLNPGAIPIVQSDRGGQITYHGPGQLVTYVLLDIQRRKLGIRNLVCQLEQSLIETLRTFDITAQTQCGAPGVYVLEKKIASIGLRVKNGCTYHGIALNVAMDLKPFLGIHPCGFKALEMTQMRDYIANITVEEVQHRFSNILLTQFLV